MKTITIKKTMANEQGDSPIFQLLPGLESMDPSKVVVVPLQFREQVEQKNKDIDGLTTLLNQAIGKPWETEGVRLIGTAQFNLGMHKEACASWERIRKFDMYDAEANQKLATSYQKLGEYTLSEQAAKRALENHPSDWDKAETHALIASNYKTRWRNQWETEDNLQKRQQEAEFELRRMAKHCGKLAAATELAIDSSLRNYPDDAWALLSLADLLLLTSDRPKRVKQKYQKCTIVVEGFTASSVLNQVKLYQTLGLFEKNVSAALEIIGEHHA